MSDYDIDATITADDSGYMAALDRITSGLSEWGLNLDKLYDKGDEFASKFGVDIDQLAGKFGTSGEMLTALAGVGVVAAEVGKKLFEVGEEFDETSSIIGKATGATGSSLENMDANFQDLMGSGIEQNMNDVAAAFSQLSVKLDLTGKPLEDLTKKFADYADVNHTSVTAAVESATDVLNKWNISADQAPDLLDQLTKASQLSGTSAATFADILKTSGSQLQNLGLSLTDSIAMFAAFEKDGVNAQTVMRGLNTALADWSKEGKDASVELKKTFDEIKNAKDPTEALNIAVKTFGSRAGSEMVTAIRSGKSSIEDFEKAITTARGSVDKTDEATKTFSDKMSAFGNQIKASFAPVGEVLVKIGGIVLDELVVDFQKLMDLVKPIFDFLKQQFDNVKTETEGLATAIDGIVHGDWKKAWDGAQLIVLSAAKMMTDALSMLVNVFIGAINNVIITADQVLDKIHLHIGTIGKTSLSDLTGITAKINELKKGLEDTDSTVVELGQHAKAAGDEFTSTAEQAEEIAKAKAEAEKQGEKDTEEVWKKRGEAYAKYVDGLKKLYGESLPLNELLGKAKEDSGLSEKEIKLKEYYAHMQGNNTSGAKTSANITSAVSSSPQSALLSDNLRKAGNDFDTALMEAKVKLHDFGYSLSQPVGTLKEAFSGLGNSLISSFKSLGSLMSSAGPSLLSALTSIKSVQQVMNPLQTIIQAAVKILEPLINTALKPLITAFDTIGVILADSLVPILDLVSPIIEGVANVLMWLSNNVMIPVGNFIIGIWNAIANTINHVLGWLGVHLNTASVITTSGVQAQVATVENGSSGSGEYSNSYLGYAAGTDYVPSSGYYKVGELGAETVYLPQGASVANAKETAAGGKTNNVTVNITSPKAMSEADAAREIRQVMRGLAFQGSI